MIYGIGTDIIEVARVERACQKETFCKRCFTKREVELFGRYPQSLAGNFAAKEAVSKALGCGFSVFPPSEIEILRDACGKPYVILHGKALQMMQDNRIQTVFVSISNLKEYATAISVAECKEADSDEICTHRKSDETI